MVIDREQVTAFAQRSTSAWCSGEPTNVAEHYAPDGSLTINDSAAAVGQAAISEVVLSFMTAFPDLEVVMDDLRLDRLGVEYHWTLIGTNSGPRRNGTCGPHQWVRGVDDWRRRTHRQVVGTLRPGRIRPSDHARRGCGITRIICGARLWPW